MMLLKLPVLYFFLLAVLQSPGPSAQSAGSYEGNNLVRFLGKNVTDSDMKSLETYYECEMVNETRYVSKSGIELIFQKNLLNEIHIYKNSAVYGSFSHTLPGNLRFGLSSGEVKKLLGKPSLSYSSGYCEFELADCLLSCWFDGAQLSQVGLALKSGM